MSRYRNGKRRNRELVEAEKLIMRPFEEREQSNFNQRSEYEGIFGNANMGRY
jgi:hypothetical protein